MAKADVKQQMNDELNKFSALRNQYKKIIGMRGQLEIQLNENKLVKEVCCVCLLFLQFDANPFYLLQELDLLEDSAKTFKLIGPALIKIDLKEAKDNVNNRVKYINEEL